MKIFLLGATGGTGGAILEQGLARDHQITALVRSPEKITIRSDSLAVHRGDPTDAEQIARVLVAQDVVITTLGHRDLKAAPLLAASAKSVIQVMRAAGMGRLLALSAALLFPDVGPPVLTPIIKYVLRNGLADSREMEQLVMGSGLDWTIARPPRLTNGPKTESYQIADGSLPGKQRSISRADVAHFFLNEAERPAHVRKIVGLCY
jgi:putative NADH-flavin reductase